MSEQPRLIASYFTLAGNLIPFAGPDPSPFSLAARAQAAAEAGFVGLGLETCDLRHLKNTLGYAGIRAVLADAGLTYLELEVLTDWFADGEQRARSDATRAFLLEAAAELGVAQIKTVGEIVLASGDDAVAARPVADVGAAFGQLCREAARAGTRVSIEIVPSSAVRDLATARAIVETAGEANGGILIDIWHMARGGITYEDILSLPPHLVTAVEVDDAMTRQVGSIFEDTIRNRKLPGEGELDVPRFLRVIRDLGYRGVYGIEMVSDEHRARPLREAAQCAFDATMRQFAAIAG